MAKFGEVLRNKNFLLLWLGQIVSQFGDRLNQMSLIALIYARFPGSTLQLAKIISCAIIPAFLVGPFAASFVDRWNRRRTMFLCDFLRAGLVLTIVFYFAKFNALWPIYIVIFLVFSVSRFFIPAKLAIIPELVPRDELLLANSLSSVTGMIAAVIGFGLGGLIVERLGPRGGYFIDALTYFVSGFFIFTIATKILPRMRQKQDTGSVPTAPFKRSVLAEFREGWRFLVGNKGARFVAGVFFLVWSAVGAIYVVAIVFVQEVLGSVTKDLGLIAMCLGLGLFTGALTYGRFGQKFSKVRVIFFSLTLSGLALSAFAVFVRNVGTLEAAAFLSLILGLTLSPIVISSHTLMHEISDDAMRGRVFGSLEIIGHLGFLIFMLISSWLAEYIQRFWILLAVGIIFSMTGALALLFKVDKKKVVLSL